MAKQKLSDHVVILCKKGARDKVTSAVYTSCQNKTDVVKICDEQWPDWNVKGIWKFQTVMSEQEFIERLEAAGYECTTDGVVMVKLDTATQSASELRQLVKDVIGWPRSWGFTYDSPPAECSEESAKAAEKKGKKVKSDGRSEKSGAPRKKAATDPPDVPGQMNIFDFLAR